MVIIRTDKPLKKRARGDFYPTPIPLCKAALSLLPDEPYQWILDPGAGAGAWGIAARAMFPQSYIVGVERYELHYCPEAKAYDQWHYDNFLTWTPTVKFSTIVGNPPYILAQQFAERGLGMLDNGGHMLFLLRLAFLESQKRYEWWRSMPIRNVWVLANRPSFTGNGKTDETAYALYLWEKGYQGRPELDWLFWETSDAIHPPESV